MRRVETPHLQMDANLRNGILYRGEVEILQINIINSGYEVVPLVHLELELPESIYFVDSPGRYNFTLEPSTSKTFNIPILGSIRGHFSIGPITLSIRDPFAIFENEIQVIEQVDLKIYPQRLGRRVAKSRAKSVFSKLIGFFATPQRGIGTDFHGLRDYIRGDPSRIVDWKATARANKLISKEFEEEKRIEVIIALAAGTTTRGSKFDFMLGVAMDIYEGFTDEGKPVGFVLFDKEILLEYPSSPSPRRKMKIWASIYDKDPRDIYADYAQLDSWVNKNGITNHLMIILGDLEGNYKEMSDSIRNIKLRGNDVIFVDIWGYPFSYEQELEDVAVEATIDQYGDILGDIIGRGIRQYNIFRGLQVKKEMTRGGIMYGYLTGPEDTIIDSLDRAMFSMYGDQWKVRM